MMRTSPEGDPRLTTRRKGLFLRLLEALHHSRRRNAITVLRRYDYLIAEESRISPESHAPPSRPNEKSSRNAHGSSTLAHAIRRARRNARNEFA
jgi:hypothetical protein